MIRELALISLAVAAGIKIYPAVFGAILLKEKKWKESARCIIYGVLCFIVPSYLYGGPKVLLMMFRNLSRTTSMFVQQGYGFKVNISNTIELTNKLFDLSISVNISVMIFVAILIISFLICDKLWAESLALSLMCISIPSFSYTYCMIFLVIPIMLFISDTNDGCTRIERLIWLAMFILSIAYIPCRGTISTNALDGTLKYQLTCCNLTEMIMVITMGIGLLLFGVRNLITIKYEKIAKTDRRLMK